MRYLQWSARSWLSGLFVSCCVFAFVTADLREIVITCHGCVSGVVERHGGFLGQTTADGVTRSQNPMQSARLSLT
jgi:hypothetical protein